jgi:hypothetical protein
LDKWCSGISALLYQGRISWRWKTGQRTPFGAGSVAVGNRE